MEQMEGWGLVGEMLVEAVDRGIDASGGGL